MKNLRQIIESHNAVAYVVLAKGALWLVSATLFGMVLGGDWLVSHGDTAVALAVVQACQALAFIAITVLGYHGYKGHRLLHELRHWSDPVNVRSTNDPPNS